MADGQSNNINCSVRITKDQGRNYLPLLRDNLIYLTVVAGMVLAFITIRNFADTEPRMVRALIGYLCITLVVLFRQYLVMKDNRRLNIELQQIANTDPLTQPGNRRFFEEILAQEIERAGPYHRPPSLLLMDMDNYKK